MNHQLSVMVSIVVLLIFQNIYIMSAEETTEQLEIKVTQITNDTAYQEAPIIWGDTIVWQERINTDSNYEIYSFNISSKNKNQITSSLDDDYKPHIYGDNIVWWIYSEFNASPFYGFPVYNMNSKETRIVATNATNAAPIIYKDKIVYGDIRNEPYLSIYMYNLSTTHEILICSTIKVHNLDIDIWENFIVWKEYHDNQYDIYLFDLNTMKEERITNTPGDEEEPKIFGENIVWYDRGGITGSVKVYNHQNKTIFKTIDAIGHNIYGENVITSVGGTTTLYNITSDKSIILKGIPFCEDLYENKIVYTTSDDGTSQYQEDLFLAEFTFIENGTTNGNNTDDDKDHNSLSIPSATLSFLVMSIIIIAVIRRRRE